MARITLRRKWRAGYIRVMRLPVSAAVLVAAAACGGGGGASGDDAQAPADSGSADVVGAMDRTSSDGPASGSDAAPSDASAEGGGADAADGSGIHLSGTPKIMPFGDSITAVTCWRARLWEELVMHGLTKFKMVGSQDSSGNCNDAMYDGHNEGHSGYLVTNLANEEPNGEMDTWFSANPPDVVLMHIGTNDVWNKIATATILSAYGVAIDTLRKYAPNVVIVLAKIIPMAPQGCASCPGGVMQLDAAIPAWAAAKSTAASPIVLVDQWTGFDDTADTVDGVHPNDTTGSQKMADRWYATLAPML